MNYERGDMIEMLAAEYVLGTLRGAPRRRFERLCASNAAADAARIRWEDRLAALALKLKPEQPRDEVWRRIRGAIGADVADAPPRTGAPAGGAAGPRRVVRWLPLAAAAALLGFAVWLGPRLLHGPTPTVAVTTLVVTTLGADPAHAQWRVERTADAHRLRVVTLATLAANPEKAYELWALPGDGKPPVSLGLLPRQGDIARPLNDIQSAALLAAGKLAVSIEPPGGSPTGAPTGPVVMVGVI
jgi:anti-sigma-K factor RskA